MHKFIAAAVAAVVISVPAGAFAETETDAPLASGARSDRGSAPADRVFIVAAGDSLVSGSGARKRESWPAVLEDLSARATSVQNEAIGGSCLVAPVCGDVLSEHFDERVLDLEPDLILVGSGRNDLCHLSTKDLVAGYRDLRDRATAAGIPIRFSTITPVNANWPWPCETQRTEVNDWLRTLPGTLDLEQRVSTPQGLLRGKYAYSDGLHLNAVGYAAAGRFAWKQLRPEVASIVADRAARD